MLSPSTRYAFVQTPPSRKLRCNSPSWAFHVRVRARSPHFGSCFCSRSRMQTLHPDRARSGNCHDAESTGHQEFRASPVANQPLIEPHRVIRRRRGGRPAAGAAGRADCTGGAAAAPPRSAIAWSIPTSRQRATMRSATASGCKPDASCGYRARANARYFSVTGESSVVWSACRCRRTSSHDPAAATRSTALSTACIDTGAPGASTSISPQRRRRGHATDRTRLGSNHATRAARERSVQAGRTANRLQPVCNRPLVDSANDRSDAGRGIFLLAAPDAHRYLLAGVRRPVSRLAPDMLDRNLGLPAPAASAHQITSLVGLVVPLAPAVLHPRGFAVQR